MASSRKNQTIGLQLGPIFIAVLICGAIVASCVGYVWQKRKIGELSKEYLAKETRLKKLREENVKLRNQLVIQLSPQILDQRARDMKLGLGLPQAAQIWRLPEPSTDTIASPVATQVKAGQDGSLAAQ